MVDVKFHFLDTASGTMLKRWTLQKHRRGTKLQEYVKHGDARTNPQKAIRAKFQLIKELWRKNVAGSIAEDDWGRLAARLGGAQPLTGYQFFLGRGMRAWISAQPNPAGGADVSFFVPFSTEGIYAFTEDPIRGFTRIYELTEADRGKVITVSDSPPPIKPWRFYLGDVRVGVTDTIYRMFCNAKEDKQAGTAQEAIIT